MRIAGSSNAGLRRGISSAKAEAHTNRPITQLREDAERRAVVSRIAEDCKRRDGWVSKESFFMWERKGAVRTDDGVLVSRNRVFWNRYGDLCISELEARSERMS